MENGLISIIYNQSVRLSDHGLLPISLRCCVTLLPYCGHPGSLTYCHSLFRGFSLQFVSSSHPNPFPFSQLLVSHLLVTVLMHNQFHLFFPSVVIPPTPFFFFLMWLQPSFSLDPSSCAPTSSRLHIQIYFFSPHSEFFLLFFSIKVLSAHQENRQDRG